MRVILFTGLWLTAVAARSQTLPPVPGHGECAAISARDPQLAPLTDLCRFARAYRQSLPNFVCDETVSAHDDRPFNHLAPRVLTDVVTYADGEENYSDISIDGVSASERRLSSRAGVPLITSGEFGNNLVALFRPPIAAQFHFVGERRLRGKPALVFEFHLAAATNTFWSLRDASGTTNFPEYRGTVWIAAEPASPEAMAGLLRMELQPVSLAPSFLIDSAQVTTDYAPVALGEAGRFLLPTRSETWACVRSEGELAQVRCARNQLRFHGCRKFAATARILSDAR
ncbi:MAG TPA: hypothetical protein VFU76_01100 [Terriglobales bacterium]|nr:hypothetical protein [Terriglobales bacterium]